MKHPKPKVLLSACIEHSAVRFDATMISSSEVKGMIQYFDFITVCPEMAIGMPAPRDTIRIVQGEEDLRLLSSIEGNDYTDKMRAFSKKYLTSLSEKSIDGAILKAKSPTCGTDKIKIYKGTGKSQPLGTTQNGFFAEEVVNKYTDYPIETERRLSNFTIRENFFIRVFTTARFKYISDNSMKNLVNFHSTHKYLFMSYNQNTLKALGKIVANHEHLTNDEVYDKYYEKLLLLLKSAASKPKRINVLTHIYGYFKEKLSEKEKEYYFSVQEEYLNNQKPYIAPLSILKGYAIRFDEEYLKNQILFDPYPKQLITQLDSGKRI